MFLCFNHESLAFFQDPKSEKTNMRKTDLQWIIFLWTVPIFQIADNWGIDDRRLFWARLEGLKSESPDKVGRVNGLLNY